MATVSATTRKPRHSGGSKVATFKMHGSRDQGGRENRSPPFFSGPREEGVYVEIRGDNGGRFITNGCVQRTLIRNLRPRVVA